MRKGRNGEKNGEKMEKIMVKIEATNVVASRPPNGDQLQRRPLVPISISMCGYMGVTRWGDATILTVTKEYSQHCLILNQSHFLYFVQRSLIRL